MQEGNSGCGRGQGRSGTWTEQLEGKAGISERWMGERRPCHPDILTRSLPHRQRVGSDIARDAKEQPKVHETRFLRQGNTPRFCLFSDNVNIVRFY